MTTVRELISRVRFQVDQNSVRRVNQSFAQTTRTAQNFTTRLRESFSGMFQPLSEEAMRLNRQISDLGRSLTTKITLPIVAFGGFALRASSNFEEAMNRVQAVTGASGQQFDSLNEKAKELGATTAFSATEVAQGMGFLAQAGLDVNQVLESINPALQLAAAGQLSLAEASDISTNIMTQFRLEAQGLNMVNDVLAKTVTSTNTDVRELGNAFEYAGGVASAAGFSIHQTSQFLGAMANVGVRGSRAGTALSSALSRLQQAASGAGRMAKVTNENFEAFGITMQDFQSDTGEIDLAGLIKQLSQFSNRSDFAGRVMRIFGEEAGRTFISLAKAPDMLDDVITKTAEFEGSAARMQKTMEQGLPGAIKVFKSTFESLQLAFIDSIKPILIPLIKGLSDLFAAFSKLQPETQRLLGIITLLAAAIGPLLMGVAFFMPLASKIVASLALIKTAIIGVKLSALLLPIAIIGAVSLILLAIDDLFAFIKGKPSLFGEMIRQSGGDVERIRAILTTVWSEFEWLFGRITDGWKRIFGGEIIEASKGMLEAFRIRVANSKFVPDFIKEKTLKVGAYKFPELQPFNFNNERIAQDMNVAQAGNNSNISVSPTVNVTVSNTNASPEQIGQAVQQAIEPNLQKTARQLRQNNENVYEN